MAIISNGQIVPAPAPGVRRYGLFSAATVTDDLDARGIAAGFQFPAEDCGTALVYDANCVTNPAKEFEEGYPYVGGSPYWAYATRQCGTVGKTAAEMEASVRRRLAAAEQQLVEAQLWGGGALESSPSLVTDAGVVTVTPAAAGSSAAIAALEEAFYDTYGYAGIIHINTQAYGNLAYGNMLVRANGGQLNTPIGSVWSIGSGYGINGPAEVAPTAGSVWAFMTPPVLVRRSEIIVPPVWETADRIHNQFMALAERVYAHAWVCDTVFAVEVPVAAPAVQAVTP